MIVKAVFISIWACAAAAAGMFAGTSLKAATPKGAPSEIRYMQMPLIALPVLSERKLNGLLFFKAGLSWTSTMPDTPDEVVATVFLDATVNAGFERALSTQADVVNMDEKAFAADIKEKMVAIGAPIKDAELLVLQLEYFDQAALRSPTLDIDDSE